jgi:hypothetical protein
MSNPAASQDFSSSNPVSSDHLEHVKANELRPLISQSFFFLLLLRLVNESDEEIQACLSRGTECGQDQSDHPIREFVLCITAVTTRRYYLYFI